MFVKVGLIQISILILATIWIYPSRALSQISMDNPPTLFQQLHSQEEYQSLSTELASPIRFWVLEGVVKSQDLKAVQIRLKGEHKLEAKIEIERTNSKKNREKKWTISLYNSDGRINDRMYHDPNLSAVSEAIGLIQFDACNRRAVYKVRLIIDFGIDYSNVDQKKNQAAIQFMLGASANNQQTLFKYPSEKSSSLAVILMRSTTTQPEYINFVDWRRSKPRNLLTLPVTNYYFSRTGIYTRVYMPTSKLTGERVSMDYISPSLNNLYSVCVSLSKKRQELEGYSR